MPLKVIDKTGRLPKNPKDWPEELKRAIAECCCEDGSSSTTSSDTSSQPNIDTGCCGCDIPFWPYNLTATVVSSTLGTIIVPLERTNSGFCDQATDSGIITYRGQAFEGNLQFVREDVCNGTFGFTFQYPRGCVVELKCWACATAPGGKFWWAAARFGGILGGISAAHETNYITQLLDCNPIIFQQHSAITPCADLFPKPPCCPGNNPDNDVSVPYCLDRSQTPNCDGATLQVDISE